MTLLTFANNTAARDGDGNYCSMELDAAQNATELLLMAMTCVYGTLHHTSVKGTVSRDFLLLVFFMNQFFPQLQSIPLGPLQIFSKIRGDIRKSRCTTGINYISGKFATGVNNTGGKFCHNFY